MPSYAELASEPPPGGTAWLAQITPANMTSHLLVPLRAFYGLGPTAIGAAGDNNHLYGRHRSRDWCISSRYCTNKFYGTTDARDRAGPGNIYRAVDIGISGPPLWEACRRIDAAVRAGKLPGLAEWFGTFDGRTVVGWYEGRPSSSDDSHLWHFHGGFWNGSADGEATMRATYATFTGTSNEEDNMAQMLVRFADSADPNQVWLCDGMLRRKVKPEWVDDASIPGAGNGPITNAQAHQAELLGNLSNHGGVFTSAGDPDVWGLEYPPTAAPVAGEVTLSEESLDAVEARAFEASQRAEDE